MNHLLKLSDLSTEEIHEILNLADQLKYERKNGIPHKHLEGKTLGMIFQKSSTRTRVSFEVGMYELGGNPMFLSSNDLQIGRGEPVEDTVNHSGKNSCSIFNCFLMSKLYLVFAEIFGMCTLINSTDSK